jgi:hypothetical protein
LNSLTKLSARADYVGSEFGQLEAADCGPRNINVASPLGAEEDISDQIPALIERIFLLDGIFLPLYDILSLLKAPGLVAATDP